MTRRTRGVAMYDDPFGLRGGVKKSPNLFGDLGAYSQHKKTTKDSRRAFTRTQKNEILAQQRSKCAKCRKFLDPRAIEYDHAKAWSAGGKTTIKNGRALCPTCHKLKTHKDTLSKVDKKRTKRSPNPLNISLLSQPPRKKSQGPFGW